MERSPQELINLKVSADSKLRFYTDPDIQIAIADAENALGDDGRVIVRPSGTEPLIRIMTEGNDCELISETAHKLASVIEKVLI